MFVGMRRGRMKELDTLLGPRCKGESTGHIGVKGSKTSVLIGCALAHIKEISRHTWTEASNKDGGVVPLLANMRNVAVNRTNANSVLSSVHFVVKEKRDTRKNALKVSNSKWGRISVSLKIPGQPVTLGAVSSKGRFWGPFGKCLRCYLTAV